ncbi:TraB/GumN family protein [Dyadobacter luticola]|uniref:TraB/GumN family protein n=1 Tax=Dyadobacter luticola TaxID=1979387 RepID=A0A5R9L1W9_9BACT|nr:TraB/GumN family protein [Dyadobacter luticola]TLV02562.1 TraB/GumN family protein [Dyadobacter luticola]
MLKDIFCFILPALFLCSVSSPGEIRFEENPKTILWKISGNGLKKPSYLLGTHHLLDSAWLFQFPKIKAAVDSSEFLLTEVFSTDPINLPVKSARSLKAVSIITSEQYQTLDSFFVVRVGEGIKNNTDAAEMNVAEMWDVIMQTLVADRAGGNGVNRSMDQDLFNYFKSKGKKGDHLDKVKNYDFDSSRINDARNVMQKAIALIPGSDKPGWNIYSRNIDIQHVIDSYKQMNAPYELEKTDTPDQPVVLNDYGTLEQRNRYWIPKIEKNMTGKSCLIAVGFAHLKYKTGLIVLLREKGYRVEPVL